MAEPIQTSPNPGAQLPLPVPGVAPAATPAPSAIVAAPPPPVDRGVPAPPPSAPAAPEITADLERAVLARLGLSSRDEAAQLLDLRRRHEAQQPDAQLKRERDALAETARKAQEERDRIAAERDQLATEKRGIEASVKADRFARWLDDYTGRVAHAIGLVEGDAYRADLRTYIDAHLKMVGEGNARKLVFHDGPVKVEGSGAAGAWTDADGERLTQAIRDHYAATRPRLIASPAQAGAGRPAIGAPGFNPNAPISATTTVVDPRADVLASVMQQVHQQRSWQPMRPPG